MVVDKIVQAIKSEYPDLKVYTDKVIQGVSVPCFVIQPVDYNYDVSTTKRRIENYTYSVTYLAEDREDTTETQNMRTTLCQILEFIDIAHCTNMSANIDDGVLQVTCSYTIHKLVEDEPEEVMEDLILTEEL